ncbi:MAG: flavodoxin domain-containing protein [Clostridia bacterium]
MTNKTAVVYRTRYGSTRKYAEWIARELDADLLEGNKTSPEALLGYDTIVYGGALYPVGILGFTLIKKNYQRLREKKIIVFSVGASPATPKAIEDIRTSNFTDEMQETVEHYHFRGGFEYAKLSFTHKVLMGLLKRNLQKKDSLDNNEPGMMSVFNRPVDWTDKKTIRPLLEKVKGEQID